MQGATELPTSFTDLTDLTEHHESTLTLQTCESSNSIGTDSTEYGESVHSITPPTRYNATNSPNLNFPDDNREDTPEHSYQQTSWFALNCLPSLKNAAIYLFACGAVAMVTGISLASAPITIAGGALAGVGLLLGLYGKFNCHQQKTENERTSYADEWNVMRPE